MLVEENTNLCIIFIALTKHLKPGQTVGVGLRCGDKRLHNVGALYMYSKTRKLMTIMLLSVKKLILWSHTAEFSTQLLIIMATGLVLENGLNAGKAHMYRKSTAYQMS